MSLLAKRYARALFLAAAERDATDRVESDLDALATACADPEIGAILFAPEVPTHVKERALVELLAEHAHELTRNLVRVLLGRRRLALLPRLREPYRALVREARGEVEGLLETAWPLSAEEVAEIERALSEMEQRKVSLTVRENPDLIGGVRVTIGTTLYDASVVAALEEMERALREAPVP